MSDAPQLLELPRPLVFAHRGGAALRPENTIEAFDHGLALGADGIELDVHLSRDGIVVVHHDDTLLRTTNAPGRVCDYTADELARLDAGYWFRPRDPAALDSGDPACQFPYRGKGIGIPTLRTVLRRYPDARLIVELKTADPALALRTVEEIRAAGAIDRVAVGCFGRRPLQAARQAEPRIRTGACREETRWALYRSWLGWPMSKPGYREFQVPERSGATTIVSPRFVAYAHRAGIPVQVWTVDDEPDMRRLISWGVDGLITDRPDLAVRVCADCR